MPTQASPDLIAIGAPQVWTEEQGDGVRLAVIDTGVDIDHAALRPNLVDKVSERAGNDFDGNGVPGDEFGVNLAHLAIARGADGTRLGARAHHQRLGLGRRRRAHAPRLGPRHRRGVDRRGLGREPEPDRRRPARADPRRRRAGEPAHGADPAQRRRPAHAQRRHERQAAARRLDLGARGGDRLRRRRARARAHLRVAGPAAELDPARRAPLRRGQLRAAGVRSGRRARRERRVPRALARLLAQEARRRHGRGARPVDGRGAPERPAPAAARDPGRGGGSDPGHRRRSRAARARRRARSPSTARSRIPGTTAPRFPTSAPRRSPARRARSASPPARPCSSPACAPTSSPGRSARRWSTAR